MSARANLHASSEQDAQHCFADISIDSEELWRWQNRDELRGQDAPSLLPVIDANVLPEWLRACVGHEKSGTAGEVLREILRHCIPAAFVGASSAQGKSCNGSAEVATGIAPHSTNYLVSRRYNGGEA